LLIDLGGGGGHGHPRSFARAAVLAFGQGGKRADGEHPAGFRRFARSFRSGKAPTCGRRLTAQLKTMMSLFLKRASMVSFAATFMIAVYSTFGSGAAAQEKTAQATDTMVPGLSAEVSPIATEPTTLANLTEQLAAEPLTQDVSAELNCLAGAIYFESRNEPLDGQLAVGRVIVARAKSGRFPDSYCGVVYQPSQFSFVRHRAMPHGAG